MRNSPGRTGSDRHGLDLEDPVPEAPGERERADAAAGAAGAEAAGAEAAGSETEGADTAGEALTGAEPGSGAPSQGRHGTGRFRDLDEGLDIETAGAGMHAWMAEVFPLCRSITGKGLRLTLRSLSAFAPVKITEVPTGARAFDWTIPREWEIREAWIKDPSGRTVADFRESNLHVVGYSVPVRKRLPLSELRPRLHSLPDRPDWIPYRNSFWQEDWGFCLPHRRLEALPEGEYEVCIDSSLVDGSLSYGEILVPGRAEEEVLISAHACHPSLANDNLSGMAVAACAARLLLGLSRHGKPPRYTYRFLFAPVTIGSLAWLSRNEALLPRIRHGMVLSLLGDSGPFTWKQSRRGDAPVDRAAALALAWSGAPYQVTPFSPYGYDERQFCSPGFDLPMGCLMRTPFARYPEYHTSADNLDLVRPESLGGSLKALLSILDVLENDGAFRSASPMGEPQLSRRGLFQSRDGRPGPDLMPVLWVLNQADGRRTLADTAERANLPFGAVKRAADALLACGLLEERDGKEFPP